MNGISDGVLALFGSAGIRAVACKDGALSHAIPQHCPDRAFLLHHIRQTLLHKSSSHQCQWHCEAVGREMYLLRGGSRYEDRCADSAKRILETVRRPVSYCLLWLSRWERTHDDRSVVSFDSQFLILLCKIGHILDHPLLKVSSTLYCSKTPNIPGRHL